MPILTTKLYIPPPRPDLVRRPRLLERLHTGLHRKLTLISAPAGFGKTTLISSWIGELQAEPAGQAFPGRHSSIQKRAAWLSLEKGDDDPIRFLTYLVAALQTLAPTTGEGVWSALQSPQPPAVESLLAVLLNDLVAIAADFVLVLDDYHVVDAEPIDHALAFLLDHLPPQMHLVITTREDPALPLARYRARDQLTELRANDLRFTPAEAAAFLNQAMGLDLSPEEVSALESRTEGWIAGLQLAGLALQGPLSPRRRQDVHGFIRALAADNRYIVDYLVEEVLQRQPEPSRLFLLQTSILERLSGPLCEAVTGQADGKKRLETLERRNLFVVPLDNRRQWYRYHHLFADVLRARLREEHAEAMPALHLRASEWYEQNGAAADAVHHAFAAGDFARAADLVELAWRAMDRSLESATWMGWVTRLSDELVRARPVLSVGYAWALLNEGELEDAENRLRDAERWLDPGSPMDEQAGRLDAMVVADEEEFRILPASIASARAYLAQAHGDASGSADHARRALVLFDRDDDLGRAIPTAILGLTQWAGGELVTAHGTLTDALTRFRRTGNIVAALSGTYGLADIALAQGRLREAIRTYEEALQLALEQGEPVPRGTADLYLGLGDLRREQGDLDAATRHLLKSQELGAQAALPDWPHRQRIARARMAQTRGDLEGALGLLDEAERLFYRTPVPDVRPIPALKARVHIAQGRLAAALEWARTRGLSPDDELGYLHEFEHITLARVLLAQWQREEAKDSFDEAERLLDRLLQAAEAGGRMGSVLEIRLVQAQAHQALGDIPSALGFLEHALALAEPEGYVGIFVDEGVPMATLLRQAARQGIAPGYVQRLRAALGEPEETTSAPPGLPEPLSERELDVLRLLRSELSGPQIARELMVSLNTMRTHTRNIYAKLGVHNRREAVRRARELDLI